MQLRHQPAVLALSRQPLPTLDRGKYAPAAGVARGAYVLADAPGREPGSDPHRLRQRAEPRRRGPREAARRGHPLACRLDAVLGDLRSPAAGLPRRRAASRRDGPSRRRAGLHLRLGAIRRQVRPRHRHEDLRRLGAAQGAPEEVRVRAGAGGGRPRRSWWAGDETGVDSLDGDAASSRRSGRLRAQNAGGAAASSFASSSSNTRRPPRTRRRIAASSRRSTRRTTGGRGPQRRRAPQKTGAKTG